MQRLLAFLFLVAALGGCHSGHDQAAAPEGALTVTVGDFERSSFYRKHPPASREQTPGRLAYRFEDRYKESSGIEVALDVEGDRVSAFTVTWFGDASRPAAWSSIKKQFVADLLEATFWDVDYGQVSSRVMESGTRPYSASEPALPLGQARIRAGSSGSDLVVRLER